MNSYKKILISGLVNMETTLGVDEFPLSYSPIVYPCFKIDLHPSGVGLNVVKALIALGNIINLVSILGKDFNGDVVLEYLHNSGIDTKYILRCMDETPLSVALYDKHGHRQIHCDLKDIQEKEYNVSLIEKAIDECSILVLCNINFSRDIIKLAKEKNKIIATDVHVLCDVKDEYNREFMENSNILFLSDEGISGCTAEEFIKKLKEEYDNDIIVIGQGEKGSLLYVKEDNTIVHYDAVKTRKIVNTVGAGDALFASFLNYYNKTSDPYISLKKAMVFASYKIGENGASKGFVNEEQLEKLYNFLYN